MGRKQQPINEKHKHKVAIAKMLRTERLRRGLNSKEMADYLKVPKGTYPKYETGRSFPAYKHLTTILNKLNMELVFTKIEEKEMEFILPWGNRCQLSMTS